MEHESIELSSALFKTGDRVVIEGWYRDQHGFVSYHKAPGTFPPCCGRKGGCAWRQLIEAV